MEPIDLHWSDFPFLVYINIRIRLNVYPNNNPIITSLLLLKDLKVTLEPHLAATF